MPNIKVMKYLKKKNNRPANKKTKKGDDEGNLEQTKRGKFA